MYDNVRSTYEIPRGTSRDMIVLIHLGSQGLPYEMTENDKLILEVLDYRNDDKVVITKEVVGDNYFSFVPSDTEELDVGYYRYNVKLYPTDSTEVYQVIEPSLFFIKESE